MTQAFMGREVRHAVPDVETPFFVSYAHAGADSDQKAEQFFHHLCEDVAPLVPLPVGADKGFIDAVGLRGGVHWRPELTRALGGCQVLIGLLSVPYLKSGWCGKEWHAFSLRHKDPLPRANASPYQGPIIPVRWAPIPFDLPAVVNEEMIFRPPSTPADPGLPGRYRQDGIFGLLQHGEQNSYRVIVWELAKLIQQIYYGQRLRYRKFEQDELEDVFQGSVP